MWYEEQLTFEMVDMTGLKDSVVFDVTDQGKAKTYDLPNLVANIPPELQAAAAAAPVKVARAATTPAAGPPPVVDSKRHLDSTRRGRTLPS